MHRRCAVMMQAVRNMQRNSFASMVVAALFHLVLALPTAAQEARNERATEAAAASAPAALVTGTLDTVTFWSQALGTNKSYVVWLPPSYNDSTFRSYSVAYYLHGLWGRETDWSTLGSIHTTLDSLVAAGMPEFIVVMPDGDDSWYTTWNSLGDYAGCRSSFIPADHVGDTVDSYCVPWPHYDDYIAYDLVQAVDGTFRTLAHREYRAIAGLSMGGYGAVSLALRYPHVYRAAVSHSGVLSPRFDTHPFVAPPRYADMAQIESAWGERLWPLLTPAFGRDSSGWIARDPVHMAERALNRIKSANLEFYFDVGTEDGLIDQNKALHWEFARLGLPVTYAEYPGKHDWPYWRAHAVESMQWLAARIVP